MHGKIFKAGSGRLHASRCPGLTDLPPVGIQGAAPAANVAHALPGKEGGATEVLEDFVVREAHRVVELIPDVLLACAEEGEAFSCGRVDVRPLRPWGPQQTGKGEWEIDAVERHPVELALPAGPVPPGHAIRHGAHVHVVGVGHGLDLADELGRLWHGVWNLNIAASVVHSPRDLRVAERAEVVVQARGQCSTCGGRT